MGLFNKPYVSVPSGIFLKNKTNNKEVELSLDEWMFIQGVTKRAKFYANIPKFQFKEAIITLNKKLLELI